MSRRAHSPEAHADELSYLALRGPAPRRLTSSLEGYELWAKTYDEPNPVHALEERILKPSLPDLRDRAVLDIACGTGRWLAKFLDWGARTGYGVDLSRPMLVRAHSKVPLRGRLVQGDCLGLPIQACAADLLICSLAVGHVRDVCALAGELARVSKPRAEVYVSDFHPQAHARGWRRTFRHSGELLEVPSYAHSTENVRSAFRQAGFAVMGCQEGRLGEPEKRIFVARGKMELFEPACESPVIYILHFRRTAESRVEGN